ncbi:MAG TPA: helix-turn-helix transcriptional regulator, partial [Pseudonocardia sp.]
MITAWATPSSAAALAGSLAASRLLREALDRPEQLGRVDILGPAGTGKTVLLDALADILAAAGRTVMRTIPDADPGPDAAVLVDDGHRLTPDELARLAQLATGHVGVLVFAHRPWPRPDGLSALGAVLATRRVPVVLGALDRSGVQARIAHILGERAARPSDAVADLVLAQTGGHPALVDRMLTSLVEQSGPDPARWRWDPARPPAGVLAQLGYAIHRLPDGVRDLLRARALGAPLEPDLLVPLLGPAVTVDPADLDELVEAARAEGLLTADGAPIPLVSAAVLERTPPATRMELQRAIAERELERGGNVLAAARRLLGTGASGARVAGVFAAAGDESLRTGLPGAGELYAAAAEAGGPPLELASRRAEAALRAGELDLALAQADQVLSASDEMRPADVAQAGTVAAAVLAHRGMLARSAALYRFLGARMGREAVVAVPALIGTGALDEAREIVTCPSARPPTLLAGAEELMAQGVVRSVTGSPTAALSELTRAAALLESSHRAALLPDTPAALAALVAVHCGELDVAQSVLERAVRMRSGGRATAVRHRLLLGWIALFHGATGTARAALASAPAPLEPRDEFVAAALEVAIARRSGDLAALMPAWGRAREAIVRHPVDLFVLQQLGELAVAAARLRETSWVRPHLDEAAALLERLGNPALWAAPLHWSGLQAAIVAESRDDAARHAAAVVAAAGASRYAGALAAAAPHWVQMLDAEVDADAVEAAARGLHAVGLAWEGGRLAGQAAIRTRDRKAMSALLACARAMQAGGVRSAGVVEGNAAADDDPRAAAIVDSDDPGDGPLSEREREVAALVLEGLTYKQIGERLFISAKTVEHHVARMRQRLGSGSRGELFAHLRQIVG